MITPNTPTREELEALVAAGVLPPEDLIRNDAKRAELERDIQRLASEIRAAEQGVQTPPMTPNTPTLAEVSELSKLRKDADAYHDACYRYSDALARKLPYQGARAEVFDAALRLAERTRNWLVANRTALERFELERTVRAYWGVPANHPVKVLTDQGDANLGPRSVQGRMLEVGRDWKPGVSGG